MSFCGGGKNLQLLCTVKSISVLEHTHVVFCELVHDLTGDVHLTEGEFVMVTIIQDIHEICVERMDILKKTSASVVRSIAQHEKEVRVFW